MIITKACILILLDDVTSSINENNTTDPKFYANLGSGTAHCLKISCDPLLDVDKISHKPEANVSIM